MKQRPRIYYSEAQKAIMWDRWRRGETLHHIAQLFERRPFLDPTDSFRDRWRLTRKPN